MATRRPTPRKDSSRAGTPAWMPLALGAVALVVVVLLVSSLLRGCSAPAQTSQADAAPTATTSAATASSAQSTSVTTDAATTATASNASASTSSPAVKVLDEGRTTASGWGRMSFCAVGDNLANENTLEMADSWSGTTGDKDYDFSPIYTNVTDTIKSSYDVALINQETTMGGTENFNYAGYPSYNTPDSMAKAVSDAGFRVVNTNTNHTYDTWVPSILHSMGVWQGYSNLTTIGSYESNADRETVRVVECNGVRVAFLSYSYGQNGYEQSDLPNDYYSVPWDEAKMKTDVARAKQVSDAVVVYMHWGAEYKNDPSEEQVEWAQACAEQNVDLVVGSHVHVIQPVKWLQRADGGSMPCAYGMGDFVSGYHNRPDCIMSGMFSCNFVKADDGSVSIQDVVWHPLIEHWSGTTDTVKFVRDYTDQEARENELLTGLDDPRGWIIDKTREVMGSDVTLDV